MNHAPKNNLWREKDKIGQAPPPAASRQADAIELTGDTDGNGIREQTIASQIGFVRREKSPLGKHACEIRRGHKIIRLVRPAARGKNQIRSEERRVGKERRSPCS